MNENATSLALVAIVGTVITALFKLLNANTKALGKLVDSSEKVAKATTTSAKEAKQRNGHLAELVVDSKKQVIHAVSEVKQQNIGEQHIGTQVIDKVKK